MHRGSALVAFLLGLTRRECRVSSDTGQGSRLLRGFVARGMWLGGDGRRGVAAAGGASDFQQVLAEGDGDGFDAVGGTDFLKELLRVFLDHIEADAELGGDVGVGKSIDD